MTAVLAPARWRAIGTYVELSTTDPGQLTPAVDLAARLLDRLDRVASRFRADSELVRANTAAGRWQRVDPFLVAAVDAAVAAAEASGGLVHPLLGRPLISLGYDRTFDSLRDARVAVSAAPVEFDAWRQIKTDASGAVFVPAGHALDLGSSAKAWIADVIALTIAEDLGVGAVVSVGGDVAVASVAQDDPWPIDIAEHPNQPAAARVLLGAGGLATSSTVVRRWLAGGVRRHHLVDPRTSRPADGPWRTVTATGPTCLAANTASTAAIVLGEAAVGWLTERGVATRLVDADARVTRTPGWPGDDRV